LFSFHEKNYGKKIHHEELEKKRKFYDNYCEKLQLLLLMKHFKRRKKEKTPLLYNYKN